MAQNPPNNRPDGNDDENNPRDPFSAMFGQLFGGGFNPDDLPPQLREALGAQGDPAAMQKMMQQAQARTIALHNGQAATSATPSGSSPAGPARRMVYHTPYPLNRAAQSASGLRPVRMRDAFEELGYEVWEVTGHSAERRRSCPRLRGCR